jgi:hypothetical protein
MRHFYGIILVTIFFRLSLGHSHAGHLKPFGSIGTLTGIEQLQHEYPNVSMLFTDYIAKSRPIISRQVLSNDHHFQMWQTDEQLMNDVYGLSNMIVHVGLFKDRQHQQIQLRFGEFLHRYKTEPLRLVDNIPNILR